MQVERIGSVEGPFASRLDASRAQLLVVDVQERLLPHIDGHDEVVAQCIRMLRAAAQLGLPTTVSEQHPRGLGRTHTGVADAAADARRVEKMTFSVCRTPAALEALRSAGRPQVVLVGVEAHVCVQQTALDLVAEGLSPFVLADAVGSRRTRDRDVALARLAHAGVTVTTVEAAIFELLVEAGTPLFKRVLGLVK